MHRRSAKRSGKASNVLLPWQHVAVGSAVQVTGVRLRTNMAPAACEPELSTKPTEALLDQPRYERARERPGQDGLGGQHKRKEWEVP